MICDDLWGTTWQLIPGAAILPINAPANPRAPLSRHSSTRIPHPSHHVTASCATLASSTVRAVRWKRVGIEGLRCPTLSYSAHSYIRPIYKVSVRPYTELRLPIVALVRFPQAHSDSKKKNPLHKTWTFPNSFFFNINSWFNIIYQ